MASTHLSLHYHLVFGTKDHEPVIHKSWRPRLHAYIGGVITTLGGTAEAVGGVSDHVHLMVGLRATHCLADVAREIKAVSSAWVHQEIRMTSFAGQEGYGGFTVSPSQRDAVTSYITSQEEHQRTRSFREEYLQMLKLSGVEFDKRYIF